MNTNRARLYLSDLLPLGATHICCNLHHGHVDSSRNPPLAALLSADLQATVLGACNLVHGAGDAASNRAVLHTRLSGAGGAAS